MRARTIRNIVRLAAALVMVGITSSLGFAQDTSAKNAPVQALHVFNTAHVQTPGSANRTGPARETAVANDTVGPITTSITPTGIIYTCAPNIDATVAGTCAYLNGTIAGIYASRFTNASANIYIQYGITGLGGSSQYLNSYSYSTYLSALTAHSSGDAVDTAALASLPGSEPPIFSGGNIIITTALGTAFGFSGLTGITVDGSSCSYPGSGCYNGIMTITTQANLTATNPGQTLYYRQLGGTQGPLAYDFYTVVEHETDEILGTSSCISTGPPSLSDGCMGTNASPADLFRYSAPGTRVFVSTTPGAYFSYNGGATNVAVYNTLANGDDYADWVTNCQHVQDATGCLGGTFDITNDGGVELAVLEAVGFNVTPLAPSISKAFNPASIAVTGVSTLTVTITNPNNFTTNFTGVGFTDNLPAGVVVAATPSLTDSCGGTVSGAVAASTSFTLSGGTLAAGATCNVSVSVAGNTSGVKNNTTTVVTSNEGGNGNTASATLTVLGPPSISKSFSPGSIPLGGNSNLTFVILNANTVSITGVGFSDSLPAGLFVSSAAGANCDGTPVTATGGSTSISLALATLPGSSSCSFTVVVNGTTAGVKNNVTSNVVAAIAGAGNQASATLQVVAPPVISKTFASTKILPEGTTPVSFSITNPNSFTGLTGVSFTDSLPSGLVVASPNGLTSTCGGTATATAGSGAISLSGGVISSSGSCTVTATVTAPEGIYLNSVQVTSTNGGTGNTSSATLFVATPPSLSKVFADVSLDPLSSTTLSFTLTNPNHVVTLTTLAFSDTLPAGLVVSTPNGLTGSCGGGTLAAVAGGNLISLTSASLAPQANCTFSVNVTSNGTALGYLTNTTSTVTSVQALPGAPAMAAIFVGDPFQITYTANLNIGDSFVDITNTGASGAGLDSGTAASVTGSICANVYVFDASEEILSCCSCPVTPNGLVSLSAQADLVSNPLTNANHTSIVIKLLATAPVAGSCNNSALLAGGPSLALGMAAWGTSLHANTTITVAPPMGGGTGYDVTEKPFTDSSLSAGEFARLAYSCGAVANVGSGFGVCNSCRLGGLGAQKQ
jgi:hypothetical protein